MLCAYENPYENALINGITQLLEDEVAWSRREEERAVFNR
jgi:hypothetical protein